MPDGPYPQLAEYGQDGNAPKTSSKSKMMRMRPTKISRVAIGDLTLQIGDRSILKTGW